MMRSLALLLLLTALAGCVAPGGREPERYFVLDIPPSQQPAAALDLPLRIAPTTAARFYDSDRLVYSRSAGTRGYYQYSYWTERPQRVLYGALLQRFAQRPGALRWSLETQIEEVYHDAAQLPGMARVSVSARLMDRERSVAGIVRTFQRSVPVATGDAPGAVAATGQALGSIAEELSVWVTEEISRSR